MVYSISDEEVAAGQVSAEKLAAIVADIRSSGYAVVSGLVSAASCELLAASIVEDAQHIKTQDELTPHEQRTGRGHLQLGLRRCVPYVRADLLTNPLVESVVAAILGQGAWLGFYNGNVNLPGSVHQPLHYDRPFSWKTPEEAQQDGESWPPRATTLSCSVALDEITEAKGATEIYPGTHTETAVAAWPLGERPENHPELVKRWGPPARMEIPAGGVCFRDPRMWHRGMPNQSSNIRPMIALTYHAAIARHWRGWLVRNLPSADIARCEENPELRVMDDGSLGDGRLVFEESAREIFAENPSRHGINRNVRFVAAVDHTVDAHMLGGAKVLRESADA